jgi:hypothetical protein
VASVKVDAPGPNAKPSPVKLVMADPALKVAVVIEVTKPLALMVMTGMRELDPVVPAVATVANVRAPVDASVASPEMVSAAGSALVCPIRTCPAVRVLATIAEVPSPTRTPWAVRVEAPVPPLGTVSCPVMVGRDRLRVNPAPKEPAVRVPTPVMMVTVLNVDVPSPAAVNTVPRVGLDMAYRPTEFVKEPPPRLKALPPNPLVPALASKLAAVIGIPPYIVTGFEPAHVKAVERALIWICPCTEVATPLAPEAPVPV